MARFSTTDVNRIVEISNPSYLHIAKKQMRVEQDGQLVGSVPFEDLHCLILSHPRITVSQAVLQECCESNVPIIVCDRKFLPVGYLHSPFSNSLHAKLVRYQAQAKLPLKKNLWKSMIVRKIDHQRMLLSRLELDASYLEVQLKRVRSGDPENVEAQAAKYYWSRLFGKEFRREPNLDGTNSLLNYGYSVLRASVARALAGTGLNTAFGVHHRNQYNSFCLADDMMEVARPLVDSKVYGITQSGGREVSKATKAILLNLLHEEVLFDNKKYFLIHALQRSSKALADAIIENDAARFQAIKLIL